MNGFAKVGKKGTPTTVLDKEQLLEFPQPNPLKMRFTCAYMHAHAFEGIPNNSKMSPRLSHVRLVPLHKTAIGAQTLVTPTECGAHRRVVGSSDVNQYEAFVPRHWVACRSQFASTASCRLDSEWKNR